ncbi:CopG family transcriptional regulator [Phyllobacterium phragmitis]|uniref:CopG family transcriptional regulator n=1 Tax=Phyllobacterium phragmitis TaxID=2670329 RepID=A0A2S9IZ27_9HYPH|nr:ribbon-helix-helix protein, CopG family [Phyllobacterium phragmitis]PRD45754.1 CopG family transcriptional regulator [Phyllobacterium phragmitis]
MSASATMTIRVSTDVKDKLERLALGTRRSRSFLAAEAVSAYVDRELEIVEGIEKALANVKAGNVASHDEVMGEARQIIANAKTTISSAD